MALKATPRRGQTKEVEEEIKFQSCKKILFDQSTHLKAVGGKSKCNDDFTYPKLHLSQPMQHDIMEKEVSALNDLNTLSNNSSDNVGQVAHLLVEETNEGTHKQHVPFIF